MKRFIIIVCSATAIFTGNAQNVGLGTASPQATLHIKGSADSSELVLDAGTGQTNAHPLIRLRDTAGGDLMHIHSDAQYNVFMGYTAGRFNKVSLAAQEGLFNTFIGSNCGYYNSKGSFNTALGRSSLYQNTTASNNTGIGYKALFSTTTGKKNTAIGSNALLSNIGGMQNVAVGADAHVLNVYGNWNVAVGNEALYSNVSADHNVAVGYKALSSNTSRSSNTAVGDQALYSQSYNDGLVTNSFNTAVGTDALFWNNPTSVANGIYNTAAGANALKYNTTGYSNSATGYLALDNCTTGYQNTAVGMNADVDVASNYNNTIIGAYAHVDGNNNVVLGYNAYTLANNLAQIGSTTTVYCGGYANWTNYASDRRIKTNVNEDVKGLDFIMRLRPVTYHLDVRAIHKLWGISAYGRDEDKMTAEMKTEMDKSIRNKEAVRMSGFIAQEVEAAAQQSGYDFDGIKKPDNDKDHYGLTYETFVVPLVKGMQEQQRVIESQKQDVEELKKLNAALMARLEKLESAFKAIK